MPAGSCSTITEPRREPGSCRHYEDRRVGQREPEGGGRRYSGGWASGTTWDLTVGCGSASCDGSVPASARGSRSCRTAEPDDEKRRRAKALGLPLLDKLQLNATTDLVEQYAVSDEHPLATDIEPLVLLALAGRADAGVLIVKADESIPFYNPAIAAVLDLPFPPERVTLSDLRARGVLGLRSDGSPYPLEEQPLAQALTGRTPVADVVYLRAEDGSLRPFTMTSLPFFNPGGELIGVANYVSDAHHPQPRIPS